MTRNDFNLKDEGIKLALKYLSDAEKWVGSIDRSPLGSFAVDEGLLVHAHAFEMLWMNEDNSNYSQETELINVHARAYVMDGFSRASSGTDWLSIASAEMYQWLIRYDVEFDNTRLVQQDSINFRRRFLEVVMEYPDALPYYEVGIRDAALIKRCIADGVDPMLALVIEGDESALPFDSIGGKITP